MTTFLKVPFLFLGRQALSRTNKSLRLILVWVSLAFASISLSFFVPFLLFICKYIYIIVFFYLFNFFQICNFLAINSWHASQQDIYPSPSGSIGMIRNCVQNIGERPSRPAALRQFRRVHVSYQQTSHLSIFQIGITPLSFYWCVVVMRYSKGASWLFCHCISTFPMSVYSNYSFPN